VKTYLNRLQPNYLIIRYNLAEIRHPLNTLIDIDESAQNSVFTVPSVGHAPAQSVDVNIASGQSRDKTYTRVKSGVTGVTSEKVIIMDQV